jgi:hypothetical protein
MSFIHDEIVTIRKKLQDRVSGLEMIIPCEATGMDAQFIGLCRDLDYAFDQLQTWAILIELVLDSRRAAPK